MTFEAAKDKILLGLVGIGVALLGWMAISVSALNTKIAVVIYQIDAHEKRIERLESRR